MLGADFSETARRLRAEAAGQIENKRRSIVQVAFSAQVELQEGRFYASLPTQHTIPLPLFVNADFFPTNDRKRILLEDDYQGRWNKAAIGAAAGLVAKSLLELCQALPMERFWALLEGLWQCRQVHGPDSVFRTFWEATEPAAKSLPLVLATTGRNHKAGEIRLLQNVKEEREAIAVLERDLSIPIVTPDLNRHRNLLLALGVQELNIKHLVDAMSQHNLVGEPVPSANAPRCLQDRGKRSILARQVVRLQRRAQTSREGDARVESRCRLCLTTDDWLAPPLVTRVASKEERKLFKNGFTRFLAEDNDPVIRELVRGFSVEDALENLETLEPTTVWQDWQRNSPWLLELLDWLDSRRSDLQALPHVIKGLTSLRIWPSSSGLHELSELSMPGSFRDPLNLATLVHHRLAKHREFLVGVLGVSPLSIVTYATVHVPKAFGTTQRPSVELVRELVKVLAQNNGLLRESADAREALAECALVECEDGGLRLPSKAYVRTNLVEAILADDAHYASPSVIASHPSVPELFAWLGVHDKPRPHDVVDRARQFEAATSDETREAVVAFSAALGPEWDGYADKAVLMELCDIGWLPTKGSAEWRRPGELAASFREYLFETQAMFVDLPASVQRVCASMFEALGVQSEPTVEQVVNHLLVCAGSARTVNPAVYRFLSDNADHPSLNRLVSKPCISLADGTWEYPQKLFWSDHGLQPYLRVLDPKWREFSRFLEEVKVREAPGPHDAIAVLLDIARDADDSHDWGLRASVARSAWSLLNASLERDELRTPGSLSVLGSRQTLPLAHGSFGCPDALFLDDRPWISRLFGQQLSHLLIGRQEGFALALETAGLRALSSVLLEESTDLDVGEPDVTLKARIQERAGAFARVFSSALDRDANEVFQALSTLSVVSAARLAVVYRIPELEPLVQGYREEPEAWFEPEGRVLYVRSDAHNPWTGIARQIALRLAPTTNISQVTPALRDVLAAELPEHADALLDELGFTSLQMHVHADVDRPIEFAQPPESSSEPGDSEVGHDASSVAMTVGLPGTEPAGSGKGQTPFSTGGADVPSGATGTSSTAPLAGTPASAPAGGSTGLVQRTGGTPAKESRPELQVVARSCVVHRSGGAKTQSDDPGWVDVANAGIKHAREYEYANLRRPRSMAHNHPGWDIESQGDDATEVERFIEVKAIRGAWSGYGVGITETEFEKAREKGDRYWLYVVEHALGVPRLYAFQNPAAKVTEYRVDDGWRQFADESDESRPRSILDLPKEPL